MEAKTKDAGKTTHLTLSSWVDTPRPILHYLLRYVPRDCAPVLIVPLLLSFLTELEVVAGFLCVSKQWHALADECWERFPPGAAGPCLRTELDRHLTFASKPRTGYSRLSAHA